LHDILVATLAIFNFQSQESVATVGPDVTASDERASYDEVAELSALLMWIVAPVELTRTMLTRERVVVLCDDAGERDNLNFRSPTQELIDKELSGL
jgi:hypothetical protein